MNKMSIHMQIGVLEVIGNQDSNYPGVSVYLNGELVSKTEYNSDTKCVRTIAYTDIEEEPASKTDYNKRGE